MPEGPECLGIVDIIYDADYVGKKLTNIQFLKGRYKTKGHPAGYDKIKSSFPLKLIDISSHGKMITFSFKNNIYMISNLGLTGDWDIEDPGDANIVLEFTNSKKLYYSDPRSFGIIRFVDDENEYKKIISALGPDVIQEDISLSEFTDIFTKKKNVSKYIVEAIVDQKNIAGIGNYLRAEIMYAAKLSPKLKFSEIDSSDMKRLHKYCLTIPRKSYEFQGLNRYAENGTFETKVYQKKTDPHGNPVKIFKINNRSVYYSPAVQVRAK
jgi:formamidopyrimidine-DNA glycosylase